MADANDEDGRPRRFWALVAVTGLGLQLVLVVVVVGVVSSFVYDVGPAVVSTPTASFSGDAGQEYALTHEGGDALDPNRVGVLRNGEDVGTWAELVSVIDADDEVSAGDRVTVPNVEEGDTITVVWRGEDESATLFEDEVGPLRTPTPTSKPTETPQRSSNTTGASGSKTATASSFSV